MQPRLQPADLSAAELETYEFANVYLSSTSETWQFSALLEFFASQDGLVHLRPHLAKALCVMFDERKATYAKEKVKRARQSAGSGMEQENESPASSNKRADMEDTSDFSGTKPCSPAMSDDDEPILSKIHQKRATLSAPSSPNQESPPDAAQSFDRSHLTSLVRFQLSSLEAVESGVANNTQTSAQIRQVASFLTSVLHLSPSATPDEIFAKAESSIAVAKGARTDEGKVLASKLRRWADASVDLRARQERLVARLVSEDVGTGLKQLLLLPFEASEEKMIKHLTECRALLEEACCCEREATNALEVLTRAEEEWRRIQKENEEKKKTREADAEKSKLAEEKLAKREKLQRATLTYILANHAKREKFSANDYRRENPFVILGMKPKHATLELVKKAKKELLKLTHPDKCPGMTKEAGISCRLVNEAVKLATAAINDGTYLQYSSPSGAPPFAAECGIRWP